MSECDRIRRCPTPSLGSVLALALGLVLLAAAAPVDAVVNYEAGRLEINGVLLLQDAEDPDAYYYLPPVPRVSTRDDGGIELSLVKFVDPAGETSGGLLHMLVTFTLPEDELAELREALTAQVRRARLLGPVPMRREDEGSFSLVSASLSDEGLTREVLTSGRAPVSPGSKAAVAASLTPQGATLLWESLTRPTSDVSVAVHTYYEAVLPSFRARINAEVSTVYEHYSRLYNLQHAFTRRQIRDQVDELVRTGTIDIEVLDRLPEDTSNQAMQALVGLVSTKLTEVIFDQQTGFTAIPDKEVAVEPGQIPGRRKRGWLDRLFRGTGNQKYTSDNQYVLKRRQDINRGTFSINLSRNAVVKVPVDTAGNLSGIYEAYGQDESVFRVVNLADPAFQKREVFFQIDGNFASAFEELVNFAGVTLRKPYAQHPTATGELVFTREDLREGRHNKAWPYARLGEQGSDWLDYEYQVSWSLQGRQEVREPASRDEWLRSSDPIVTLAPPLERLDLEVDADRFLFQEAGMRSATVEVRCKVFGAETSRRLPVLRAYDADSVTAVAVFHDPETPVEFRVNWYGSAGDASTGTWQRLGGSFLVLAPPKPTADEGLTETDGSDESRDKEISK